MKIAESFFLEGYRFKNYKLLDKDEQKLVLEYRNNNRKWMINSELIPMSDHLDWINSLKTNRRTLYYLVYKDDVPFMSIDYHDIDLDRREAYWGYFLGDDSYKSEVLKVEKLIIEIGFTMLDMKKLLVVNDIDNHVIEIHRFFGFKEEKTIKLNGRKFLKMYLEKDAANI